MPPWCCVFLRSCTCCLPGCKKDPSTSVGMTIRETAYFQKQRLKETLIKSLSDYTLEFLYMARNHLTRIASYLRKAMTKSCIKILVESDSAI